MGVSKLELEQIRAAKAKERGGFSERILLLETDDGNAR